MNENIKEIMNEFDKINIVLPSQSELARCGYGVFNKDNETKIFDYNEFAKQYIATVLDKAGYRKQSETVKEFAEKLRLWVFNQTRGVNRSYDVAYDCFVETINNLAAKYGVEE